MCPEVGFAIRREVSQHHAKYPFRLIFRLRVGDDCSLTGCNSVRVFSLSLLTIANLGLKRADGAVLQFEVNFNLGETESFRVRHHEERLERLVTVVVVHLVHDHLRVSLTDADLEVALQQRDLLATDFVSEEKLILLLLFLFYHIIIKISFGLAFIPKFNQHHIINYV